MEPPIDTVVAQWKDIDWKHKVSFLENDVLVRAAADQEELLELRRHLVEATKEFRLLDDSEKISSFPSLLKKYQQQIDEYAKRMSAMDSVLQNALGPLLVLSDPLQCIERLQQLDEECSRLQSVDTELAELKQQNQALLQEVASKTSELEACKGTINSLKQEGLAAVNDRSELQNVKEASEKQLVHLKNEFDSYQYKAEHQLREMEDQRRTLMAKQQTVETHNIELRSEMEILSASLDQARQETIDLKQQIASTHVHSADIDVKASLLAKKESEMAKLLKDNQELRDEHANLQSSLQAMGKELSEAKSILSQSEGSSHSEREEYESTRRQLESQVVQLNKKISELTETNGQMVAKMEEQNKMIDALKLSREADSLEVNLNSVPESEKEIVSLLTNQRERFRRRNQELEQRIQRLSEENSLTKRDYQGLKTDFVALKKRMQQLESDFFFKDSKSSYDPEKGGVVSGFKDALKSINSMEVRFGRVGLSRRMIRGLGTVYVFALHLLLCASLYSNIKSRV